MNVTIRTSGINSTVIGIQIKESTGQQIYYTLDGTDPDNTSIPYTEVFEYPCNKLIKAVGYDGTNYSDIVEYQCCEIPLSKETQAMFRVYKDTTERVVVKHGIDLSGYTLDLYSSIELYPEASLQNGKMDLKSNYYIYPVGVDEVTKLKNVTILNPAEGQILFNSNSNSYKIFKDGVWQIIGNNWALIE